MVRTRSGAQYGTTRPCATCEGRQRTPYRRTFNNMYHANDCCKRHRRSDSKPYTETVRTYKRRKPL